ncbi:glutathione S-transferase family protein [Rhizobium sp. XQZ8]|uniref:glutathione S-transferase family protein n=1 Tax=Rhizobium populisoli TaxID=2859785 RepID=UPI001C683817|nr:glutathione S-transferase family protein [Rhizobium populisoli]MBW6419832.1 glutathione S-transferase family protein [Rhizobium populisoli]
MILIGQYDSSFVRRIGIALTLYGLPFEHRPWSIFGDVDKIQPINPLIRVPTMVLDDGDVIVDSPSMIDHIDSLVPPDLRLLPQAEPERHRAIAIMALATGFADKGAALFYEKQLHDHPSEFWMDRCRRQMLGVLDSLEMKRSSIASIYWFGEQFGHADIAVACAIRHISEAHPGLIHLESYPALAAHCASMEALPVFQQISQPFIAPA